MHALTGRVNEVATAGVSCPAALWWKQWGNSAVLAVIVAVSALVQFWPAAQVGLQFDRAAIAAGQTWRLITGNFVHYGWAHLAANLGAFAALCWIAGGRSRGTLAVVMLSALAVGVSVYGCAGGITTYRGVSGVDCALLAWMLVTMTIQDRGWKGGCWIVVLLLVAAKSLYEAVTGQVLLPTSAPAGVAVVGVTHVIGLAVGSLAAIIPANARPAERTVST